MSQVFYLTFQVSLSYQEILSSVQVLYCIAAVTQAVDAGNIEDTWRALSNPSAHFTVSKSAFR